MLLVTWNVNSIKVRLERLLALLDRHTPDVVCLQELKCDAGSVPVDVLAEAGYHAAIHSQPSYNGVAILSRVEPNRVRIGFDDDGFEDPQARLITADFALAQPTAGADTLTVVNGYFPNGSTVGSDKWLYKLDWMDRLRRRLQRDRVGERPAVVVGDYNVAPEDADVVRPTKWRESVLCVEPARRAVRRLRRLGLEDCFRHQHPLTDEQRAELAQTKPDEKDRAGFSWWDYRMRGWESNDALRIDHAFASPSLLDLCEASWIDVDERDPDSANSAPSDHAPVLTRFAVELAG